MTDRIRVYADTSVYGGVFDSEFERASKAFFSQVVNGRFQLVVSPIVRSELLAAPMDVRSFMSWNFRHIVHYDKIALYNAINVANGFGTIGIYSPSEVISYEDD